MQLAATDFLCIQIDWLPSYPVIIREGARMSHVMSDEEATNWMLRQLNAQRKYGPEITLQHIHDLVYSSEEELEDLEPEELLEKLAKAKEC